MTLLHNYAIKSLLENRYTNDTCTHCFSLECITLKQWLKIKSSIVDTNNCLNGIFTSFDTLNKEFLPGQRIIDQFTSQYLFHHINYKDKESKTTYLQKLDNIILEELSNANSIIIVSNASIRNNIATSIIYVHSHSSLIKKMIYYTVNITITEAELFAIKCGINQAI